MDLSSVSNVDASATRGCFLQLARICARRKIIVCAAGANSRIDWMMQTHGTAQHADADGLAIGSVESNDKIILFNDLDEGVWLYFHFMHYFKVPDIDHRPIFFSSITVL